MGTMEAKTADEEDATPAQTGVLTPFPSFLAALFDEINVKILRSTAVEFLSVKEIAEACELPMRACYRRIKALLKQGLLCPKPDDPENRGRPSQRYKSNIGDVYIVLSGGDYSVKLIWPNVKLDLSVDFP